MDTPLLSRGAIFPLHHRRVRARALFRFTCYLRETAFH